jgi:hypothetical protein
MHICEIRPARTEILPLGLGAHNRPEPIKRFVEDPVNCKEENSNVTYRIGDSKRRWSAAKDFCSSSVGGGMVFLRVLDDLATRALGTFVLVALALAMWMEVVEKCGREGVEKVKKE